MTTWCSMQTSMPLLLSPKEADLRERAPDGERKGLKSVMYIKMMHYIQTDRVQEQEGQS